MNYTLEEILETIHSSEVAHFDIRTTTLGISLWDCATGDVKTTAQKIYDKVMRIAHDLVKVTDDIQMKFGIPIINKRIATTPLSLVLAGGNPDDFTYAAHMLDKAGEEIGIDFIGGYSALVHKGATKAEEAFIETIPEAISTTQRVCSSVSLGSTHAGLNMDATRQMARIIKEVARRTDRGIGCARLVVFANVPEDNPFIAGAFHGVGEPEAALNVGISGPGVVLEAVKALGPEADLQTLYETIKRVAFKITRAGALIGKMVAEKLGVSFGIVDVSLAPTPAIGDSVAEILEAMGLEKTGTHGTTAAVAMLTDAVKKGGVMATSMVGGLSGTFIPVSEDSGMVRAVAAGALSLDKLEAMTAACSVGLDMVAIPGDTPEETIAAIIADELMIGIINDKTEAVRIIPIEGAKPGDIVDYGGLLGKAIVQEVHKFKSTVFVQRGGRIPPPITSFHN